MFVVYNSLHEGVYWTWPGMSRWGNFTAGNFGTRGNKIAVCLLAGDTFISITCLVMGLVGLLGVLSMPVALSWTLIGISGACTLMYLVTGGVRKGIGSVANLFLGV